MVYPPDGLSRSEVRPEMCGSYGKRCKSSRSRGDDRITPWNPRGIIVNKTDLFLGLLVEFK